MYGCGQRLILFAQENRDTGSTGESARASITKDRGFWHWLRGARNHRNSRSPPSHGENRGSSPLGSANDFNRLKLIVPFDKAIWGVFRE